MIIKEGQKVAIISDLHIQPQFERSGFFYNDEELLSKFKDILSTHDLLILNGDVFETYVNVKYPTKNADVAQVRKIIYETYQKTFQFVFENKDKFIIVSGNHDDILACSRSRRKIFESDLERIRITRIVNLEFQNTVRDRRVLVTHGDEEYYSATDLMSRALHRFIRVWWWIWSRTILRKGAIDQYGHYKRMHKGVIFKKGYVDNVKDNFGFNTIDALVLGHTHKPVITPILYDTDADSSEFTYVNTGYFNGITNYITTLSNTTGDLDITQRFEHYKEKTPKDIKGWNWIRFPRFIESTVRNLF